MDVKRIFHVRHGTRRMPYSFGFTSERFFKMGTDNFHFVSEETEAQKSSHLTKVAQTERVVYIGLPLMPLFFNTRYDVFSEVRG